MTYSLEPKMDSQVYGFFILLYTQQLFGRFFNMEAEKEWKHIQPILEKLEAALHEDVRLRAIKRCIHYKGWGMVDYNDINDIWYVLYCIANYRVDGINFARGGAIDDAPHWEQLLYYTLVNIANKSHKYYQEGGRGRFV
tara:strand:- start:114 stop:530 length:417 start_codon:yes stop_codon:yes gene_type:complete